MNLLVVAALLVKVAAVTALPLPPASSSLSTPPFLSGRHRELVEELTYLGEMERRGNEERRRAHREEVDASKTLKDEEDQQHHEKESHLHEGFREKYPQKHLNTAKKSKTKHRPVITENKLINSNAEEVQWMDEEEKIERPREDERDTASHWQEEDTGRHFSGYYTRTLKEEKTPWKDKVDCIEEPLVLSVTEWKKTQYPDLPEELMPIRPGGGSRFEDLEREKLEREKMSQTKSAKEDTIDTATSHDAESLNSCTTSLCLSSFIFFLTSLRIFI